MTALRCGGGGGDKPHALIASTGDVAHCLNAGGMGRQDYETETMIARTLKGEGFDVKAWFQPQFVQQAVKDLKLEKAWREIDAAGKAKGAA